MLIVFSNGVFSDSLWKLLEYPYKRLNSSLVDYADGIVVLSGGRCDYRFLAGINLFKANKSSKLIFTGGVNPLISGLPPEGDTYVNEAISMGIPEKNLFATPPVTNTFQEAKAIKKLLSNEKISNNKKIILVTSAFHMKRAKKVFEREGIKVTPYPVAFKGSKDFSALRNPLKWMPSSSHLNNSSGAIREIIGRIIYRAWK